MGILVNEKLTPYLRFREGLHDGTCDVFIDLLYTHDVKYNGLGETGPV